MSPSRLVLFVSMLALAACAPEEEPDGCVFPETPTAPTGVVDESCGWYLLSVGEHLYVNVYVAQLATCAVDAAGSGIEVNEPIYSDMEGDRPKWTFDALAQVPGNEYPLTIACDDGTTYELLVDVE